MGNERYKITASSPLLRPGLTIETEVSVNYLQITLSNLLEIIRKHNQQEKEKRK